ncbi:MAG: phospholipase D-like domain-containing protein [Candidatus Poribacteria bacterium]|nr:phospholipase D-like domain-containing protein [Candidatus Poribacteria bacterium]
MHNDPRASEIHTTPENSKPKLLVPFILVLLSAVAIGLGIRHYRSGAESTTETAWEVYFSEIGAGVPSLEERLTAKLTDAVERIDAALYHLNSAPIADALIEAHNRGVQVRMVTETDNIDEEAIGRLQEVGIPVADDGDPDRYMHHKFIVIDERYVWTGSYNTTYNGAYKNNNNVIFIDSVPLAYNFVQEFRELFLDMEVGKPSGGFLTKLSDGTQISTYFSPKNNTISPLLKEVQSAKTSIHFMAFSFTHDTLGEAMRACFESGVDVQGVFEKQQVDDRYSEYNAMKNAGVPVILDENRGAMHHKVIVIDGETVITGSYNFSKNAETRNNENLLIIKENREIAEAYLGEFERITR